MLNLFLNLDKALKEMHCQTKPWALTSLRNTFVDSKEVFHVINIYIKMVEEDMNDTDVICKGMVATRKYWREG